MPAQHGQTYDPQEEPTPQGGWFRLEERPYPERLDRAFQVAAFVVGLGAAAAVLAILLIYGTKPLTTGVDLVWLVAALATAGGLSYGFTRAVGMVVTGLYGTIRDGSEFVVDWRAVRHDLPLRRTWIVILEGALLLAAGGTSFWGAVRFMKHGDGFGLLVCLVIQCMIYWPLIRRRIAAGRTRG
ncbi:hypothetical protein MKK75_00260 [Methylobacterium sp. J-030]|uniref:hypothetical protein n=1 Tax=Methylobacterium sp. J-030 TaxID=2836627 RepID=UPI001FB91259|nr:hypothetical protein [Methylobacterium sp. J-030]MCJ2067254.1 hypothetical protein [Methylobacterium sp. J-030]